MDQMKLRNYESEVHKPKERGRISVNFKPDDWGILSWEIAWTNLHCPECGKYHSQSFLFQLEKDKTEYLGECHRCGETVRILIPVEVNNELLKLFERNSRRLLIGSKSLDEFV